MNNNFILYYFFITIHVKSNIYEIYLFRGMGHGCSKNCIDIILCIRPTQQKRYTNKKKPYIIHLKLPRLKQTSR